MSEVPVPRDAVLGPKRWEHLDKLHDTLTPQRRKIVDQLKSRPWFQDTKPELQVTLATLPQEGKENHDGFLADMAARPDKLGGVKVTGLADLARGNFALIPKFDVENEKGDKFTYEYVSWRYGPESGAKGLVLVKGDDGEISHFVVLRGDKFATAKKESDSVGGFADLNVDGVTSMLGRIQTEVKEELGVPDLKVDSKDIYDLGMMLPDAGMTNNRPHLFAAVIDGKEAKKIPEGLDTKNPDAYELKAGALVIPIGQLPEVIKMNNDAFFLSSVSRALAHGVIKWPQLDATPVPYRMKPKR